MVERVALATCSALPCICKNRAGFQGMPCLERGRRGLEAMRHPTEAMMAAALGNHDFSKGPIITLVEKTGDGDRLATWTAEKYTAAIDAALKS